MKLIWYILFIIIGVFLCIFNKNIKDTFSIGVPTCTQPLTSTEYSESTLDWSTNENRYGKSMFQNTDNYIIQGSCDICQTTSVASCLSALYNMKVYDWFSTNGIDCS